MASSPEHSDAGGCPPCEEVRTTESPRAEPEAPRAGDDPEESAWIAAAQAGDKDAFERLVLRYQDRVWRRALYRIGDADEAYDVAQDVFLTCFRKLHQFRGEAKFWGWLGRIVDNLVKNRHAWHERRGRSKTFSLDAPRREGEEDGPGWDPPDTGPDPRRAAQSGQARERLEESLGRLSEDHREILLLRFSDGLAYEEIAETLEISLGTVKSRINRARAELRELMGEHLE